MSLNGAWVSVTPFFVAFAITLFYVATQPHTWIETFQNKRKYSMQQYSKREKKTFWVRMSHFADAYWWAPLVLYMFCTLCSVLGYVFFKHAGYEWAGSATAALNVPLLLGGYWFTFVIMAPVIARYLTVTINRNGTGFLFAWGAFILHLAVTITMGVYAPTNPACYLQIPLLVGILMVALSVSNTFVLTNSKYVITTYNGKPCDEESVRSYQAGGCVDKIK